MEESVSFGPLLLVVVLAAAVPLVLSRFPRLRLPVVVGEILVGIIIGDSGLGLVGHDPMLAMLALLGFAYLMFLSGLEVDFDAVLPRASTWRGSWQERLQNPLGMGVVAFLLTLVLGILAGWGLHRLDAADDAFLAALILSTTSLGLVMPVLKERGLTQKAYGQTLLVAAVIADFATMLLVTVYVVIRTRGLQPDVLLVLVLFGAFATAYRLARLASRRFPGLNLMNSVSHATSQVDVRGAFAIGLAFIALAQGLGAEMILGAFLGGALISLLSDRGSDLHHKLDMFGYAFFIPIFFIMVGVRFDFSALLESPRAMLLVPALLVLAYGIKFLSSLVLRSSFSWRETLAGGALLSSRLSLIIAISAIGVGLGAIDAATNAAIILVAIVTSTVSPYLFIRLAPEREEEERKYVIVGAGRRPGLLARRLGDRGEAVVFIDCDESQAAVAEELGVPLIQGSPLDPGIWAELGPETIRAVAVLLRDEEANLEVSRYLREELGIGRVVSRLDNPAHVEEFTDLGVQAINPSLSPVVELEYLLLFPSVSSLMTDLKDDHDVAEVNLRCLELANQPLSELPLPEGAMVVLVRRDGEVIYPRGSTRLQLDDTLTVMGSVEGVRELVQLCA
jgi:Kef-type K+ transport system membrane component KefB/Trk K+ transport system NAD-binding subunit